MTRVLGGGKSAKEQEAQHEYSTLGLEPADAGAPSLVISDDIPEPNVTVLVEAPMMDSVREPPGATCAADVEMQTADTMQLHPLDAEAAGLSANEARGFQENEIDAQPVNHNEELSSAHEPSFSGVSEMNEASKQQIAPPETGDHSGDAFLELGDFHSAASADGEESILDLESETRVLEAPSAVRLAEPSASFAEANLAVESPVVPSAAEVEVVPAPIGREEWARVPEAAVEETFETSEAKSIAAPIDLSALSPEVIDAIARRAVEQLSDKVVREIAWEVVPDLAELLIKQRLDEDKG